MINREDSNSMDYINVKKTIKNNADDSNFGSAQSLSSNIFTFI